MMIPSIAPMGSGGESSAAECRCCAEARWSAARLVGLVSFARGGKGFLVAEAAAVKPVAAVPMVARVTVAAVMEVE